MEPAINIGRRRTTRSWLVVWNTPAVHRAAAMRASGCQSGDMPAAIRAGDEVLPARAPADERHDEHCDRDWNCHHDADYYE